MRLGDPSRNRQAQSCAAAVALGTRACFIGTEKALENARSQFGRNASSGVRNAESVLAALEMALYRDSSPFWGVFDRVIQQIQHHPAQQRFIRMNRRLHRVIEC